MKLLVFLIAVLAIATAFNFAGTYDIDSKCSIYNCPKNKFMTSTNTFQCPKSGKQKAQISYNNSTRIYNASFKTSKRGSFSVNFNTTQIKTNPLNGDQQIQIPFNGNTTLNLQPCNRGRQTSSLCPSNMGVANRTVIAWKSQNGKPLSNCSFKMTAQQKKSKRYY